MIYTAIKLISTVQAHAYLQYARLHQEFKIVSTYNMSLRLNSSYRLIQYEMICTESGSTTANIITCIQSTSTLTTARQSLSSVYQSLSSLLLKQRALVKCYQNIHVHETAC
eukprot:10525-Heterococcus_DN1.PRE.1